MFFFDVSAIMAVLYCQYDLGFDPFLVGNGFHFLFFFVISELYIYIFLMIFII